MRKQKIDIRHEHGKISNCDFLTFFYFRKLSDFHRIDSNHQGKKDLMMMKIEKTKKFLKLLNNKSNAFTVS